MKVDMAPRIKVQLPVGSAQWIQDENRQIAQFFTQEAEDFSFSARNEIEWLNEHMAEIFSKNQVNVTEIFKTPGKLRGKTPRTNRKRNAIEVRQPLTDMFATNAPLSTSRLHAGTPSKTIPKFHVATDPVVPAAPKLVNPHTDSGYHGTSDDDMDVDIVPVASSLSVTQEKMDKMVTIEIVANEVHGPTTQKARERTTEGSFHSAKEEIPTTGTQKGSPEAVKNSTETVPTEMPDPPVNDSCLPPAATMTEVAPNDIMDLVEVENDSVLAENPSLDASHSSSADSTPAKMLLRKSSLTFAALPAREPLTTKKSIGTRTSGTTHYDKNRGTIGRGSVLGRYTGGKSLGGSRQPDHVQDQPDEEMDVDKPERPAPYRDELNGDSDMARLGDQSSTGQVHEKMNKIGDSQLSAPTKSIPAPASISQPVYPTLISDAQVPYSEQTTTKNPATDGQIDNDDEDWIQPPKVPESGLKRPEADVKFLPSDPKINDVRSRTGGSHESVALKEHSSLENILVPGPSQDEIEPSKSLSVANPRSPLKGGETGQLKTADKSTIAPNSAVGAESPCKTSTTPHGTPSSKRCVDGPLSASKSKLQSIMKTARGLFTSSAGVSAQAKMETLSPHSMKTRGQTRAPVVAENAGTKLKPKSANETPSSHPPTDWEARRIEEQVRLKNSESTTEGRRTRSSAEKDERRKEKEAREQERTKEEPQAGAEVEGQRAQLEQQREPAGPALQKALPATKETVSSMAGPPSKPVRQSPRRAQNLQEAEKEVENQRVQPTLSGDTESSSAAAPVQTNSSLVQKPKELRRPVKPVKEAASKSKPQPVAIRVGTLSQRIPLMNPAVPSGLQDATTAPPQRPAGPVKKPSNASTSSNNLKSSVSSNMGKPKALLAAERKKEQDEKELQRKIEQKREIERKRAAQQEELRRQEQAQQQEAERQRERERVAAAAASDPKKLAQRQAIEKRRLENGKKEQQRQASQQEKNNQPVPTNRQELGGPRPPSRLHGFNNNDYGRSVNQPPSGAVRPSGKRVFEPDIDEETTGPAHVQGGSLYPQLEAKRRRTDDEEFLEVAVRPTMLPPKRQSNARKDGPKQSIFGNGYTTSHPPSHNYHQSSSLLKTSTLNQTYQQHQQHPSQVSRAGLPHEMAKYTNGKIPFAEAPNPPPKSPLRAVRSAAPPAAKSSPQYMNGENIDLAEIPTDSEDEESEDEKAKGAMLPEWVQSPHLRQQLEIQERYVDADAVFGPARSPHMEEMFKGREHRFRSRTSSANWAGPDRLTEEEIRNDRAGREKLRRQGGWTFEL